MSHSFFFRLRAFFLALLLVVAMLPSSVFAAPSKATVSVSVVNNSGAAGSVNLSKMYVVMYSVSVVNDEWFGKKAQMKKIPAGKTSVTFSVNAGQVVDFMAFETAEDASTNKKIQFYAPPMKHFASGSDVGKLCYVAGVDFSKKLPSVPKCFNELELDYSGSDAKVSVKVSDGSDEGKPLSGVFVGMYQVSIVDSMWMGELVQVKPIPAGKKQAEFSVTPGKIVDFLAFKNEAEAKKMKKHQFTVPPHKNFSGTYDDNGGAQDGFCLIAGVDIAKKLDLGGGKYSCGNELGLVLEK